MQNFLTIHLDLIVAAIFTFLAFKWLDSLKNLQQQQQPKPSVPVSVLVATTDLQPRQRIRLSNIQWQPWSEQRLSPNLITQRDHKIENIVGASVFSPIKEGQPITKQNVILTKDFDSYSLADLIQPGMRAVSVDIDPTSQLAKYVKTGDYVDVMLTPPSAPAKTVTVLHGSYVLAVNAGGGIVSSSSSESGESCSTGSCKTISPVRSPSKTTSSGCKSCGASSSQSAVPNVKSNCTVTLEVTPEQAEFLTSIENSGSLTMSLYSSNLTEPPANWHTPIIFKQVIPKQAENLPLILIKGSKAEEIKW
jgi:Flp pilus assembly protein CpaB